MKTLELMPSNHPVTAQRPVKAGRTFTWIFAAVLALILCPPVLAQQSWQPVDDKKAILIFTDAKRFSLRQMRDGHFTLEQSQWRLEDGSIIEFDVAQADRRWVLVKPAPTLEDVLQRSLPHVEVVEIGEPFMNRESGTQGAAQWIKYRDRNSDCVVIRQYGWDDDTDVHGRVPLGTRVAVGFYCAGKTLNNDEIAKLFGRIDF